MVKNNNPVKSALGFLKTTIFEKGNLIYWLNIPSFHKSIRKIESNPHKNKIRVGFMIQCPQNWAVLQSVYEHAKKDDRFETVVLLLPEMEFMFYVKLNNVIWEKTYQFGEKTFGDEAIRTYDPETKEWINPDTFELDYVFIPRPYETYLPTQYRASRLRKNTKVCYVPYAFPIFCDWQIMYNTHFIRNVYMIFCEKTASYEYIQLKFNKTIRSKDQKAYLCGYPKFDLIEQHEGNESPLWPRERSDKVLRMLWTPRWTTDQRLGGSHFFDYKDRMIEWVEEDKSIDLLFRPHPMALEHYVDSGAMTKAEEEEYVQKYLDIENANIDRTTEYYDTFYSSDILITDVSSIIMDYLFTGKPIVYCKSSNDEDMSIKELYGCLYVVGSFDEIVSVSEEIRNGNDPKKNLREELLNKLKPVKTAAENILDEIVKDYGL